MLIQRISPVIKSEGKVSPVCSAVFYPLYGMVKGGKTRSVIRTFVSKLEGSPVYSLTIRRIYRDFHGIDVGLYTIGPCQVPPSYFPRQTQIGRYSSIYYTVRSIKEIGALDQMTKRGVAPSANRAEPAAAAEDKLVIGNDVFMGHNSIILPSVREIGDGAVIGAGTVLHADVPPYAVVTGNPARVVRYRFSEDKIRELREEQWWLKSIDELSRSMDEFRVPLDGGAAVR